MTSIETVIGDALIPDVYAGVLGDYLEHCFEDYVGQTVEVLDRLPEPTSPNGSLFLDFPYTKGEEYHIGSGVPLTNIHSGSVTIMTKHAQQDQGRRHLRLLTTHLRRFLSTHESVLVPLLSEPVDELPTGVERFLKLRVLGSQMHPTLSLASTKVQVSVTEFEITTETTTTYV